MTETSDKREPYTAEEIRKIRKTLASPGLRLECPRCRSPLSIGKPIAGGGTVKPVFKVRCKRCECTAMVMD